MRFLTGHLFVVLFCAFACADVSKIEVMALNEFYKFTLGKLWNNNTGWNTDTDPCGWFGVECKNGNLTGLYLSRNNLHGRIPPSFGYLTNLQSIDFGCNLLSGEMPESLSSLTNLSAFSLRENSMTGPLRFGGLRNLQWVHLDFNHFTGYLASLFESANSLQVLGLTNNSLSGPIPNFITNSNSVKTLSLSGNYFNVNITAMLFGSSLQSIDISRNTLYGHFVENVFTPNMALQEFIVSKSQITETIPLSLASVKSLIVVDLSGNRLSGSIPKEFGMLPNILSLHFEDNKLTGTIPETFKEQTIMDVNFSGNYFDCPIPDWASYTKATCE